MWFGSLNTKIHAIKENIVNLETNRHLNTYKSSHNMFGNFLRNTSLFFFFLSFSERLGNRLRSNALNFGHQGTLGVTLVVPIAFY